MEKSFIRLRMKAHGMKNAKFVKAQASLRKNDKNRYRAKEYMSFKSVREKMDKNLMETQYSYESKEDRAASELEDKIKELEDELIRSEKRYQDVSYRLIELMKDKTFAHRYKSKDELNEKLNIAVEALEKVEHLLPLPVDGDDENEPVVIIREALKKIGEG